jgi:hypothetical protein
MANLTDVLEVSGATRNEFNYWVKKGYLMTRLAETSAGVARDISRENALEIAFLRALTHAGYSPRAAVKIVASWLKLVDGDQLPEIYVGHRGTDVMVGYSLAHLRKAFPIKIGPLGATNSDATLAEIVQTYINTRRIVERVDELFTRKHPTQ